MRNFLKNSFLILACIAILSHAAAVHAAFITLTPNDSNDFVVLEDLLPGGDVEGVIVGDKVFTDFFYRNLPGEDDMPTADKVNVFGFKDANGHWGVSFHGTFIDLPGNGPSDALLRFTVSVTEEAHARGWRISDAHLFAGGVGLGDNSFLGIDESFEQTPNQKMSVIASSLNGLPPELQLSDWIYFDRLHSSLRVTKDILALAGDNSNQPVRTTVIDQSFSQERIPEPATWCLMTLALVTTGTSRRRNR